MEGRYHGLPAGFDWRPLEEMWREAVLAMLVEAERLAETTREAHGRDAGASTAAAEADPGAWDVGA